MLKFVAARLSPEGAFGLHLTFGVLLLVLAGGLFAGIAEDVVAADRITVLDLQVAQWFHAHATPAVTRAMLFITNWHDTLGVCVMALLLAAYFYAKRARHWLLAVIVAVPGGMLLNVLLKYSFQRTRPFFTDPLVTLPTYSFPSGHTAGATLFYGVLASYLVVVHRGWGVRAAVAAGACMMVALVGLSRIYLGAHFLSDVLAAMAEGVTWLAICITAISTLRRRHAARPGQ
jgi:membrane-associated phospholipid phosphatase